MASEDAAERISITRHHDRADCGVAGALVCHMVSVTSN